MLTDWIAAARTRAAKRAPSGRGFYLESDPLPKVLPGQGLGAADDEVQLLVADGPEDLSDLTPAEEEAAHLYSGSLSSPMLTPPPGYTEQPPMRIEDAMAKFEEAVISGTLRGPTPIADDLRADRERLLAANGTLARRVRTLEAQLRAAGIEPAARE